MNWINIKEDGIPDWCGDYLVHHIQDSWPVIEVASISDTQFFNAKGEFLNATHWAHIEYPKMSDDVAH